MHSYFSQFASIDLKTGVGVPAITTISPYDGRGRLRTDLRGENSEIAGHPHLHHRGGTRQASGGPAMAPVDQEH